MPVRAKTRKSRAAGRQKISTTISRQSLAYLHKMIESGHARNLAEAIDVAVRQLWEEDWRREMDAKVSAYYDSLSDQEVEEERVWGEIATRSFAGWE